MWKLRASCGVLACLLVLGNGLPAQEPTPPAQDPAEVLRPFVERNVLAGAVTLVANKEKVLSVQAVGYADLSSQLKMMPDSVFWIASQSKPITAVLLMMLVDDGKLKLDDPIEKYLPEFRGQWMVVEQDKEHELLHHPRRSVTVRDLLRHTSGMPFASAMEQPTLDGLTLKVATRSYALTPLRYEPGTKYQYSNAGINTAGRIIEVVSGMPFERFLNEKLCQPLGMKDTTFWPTKEQLGRLARAYRPNAAKDGLEPTTVGQLTYPLDERTRQPMPAGGLFSTAADVGRFCRMMLNQGTLDGKKILSPEAVAEMTRRQTGDGIPESYGLGWAVGGKSFGHGGALATNMWIDPGRDLVTVFLVQHAGFPGDGGRSQSAFQQAAEKQFGRPR